MRRWFVFFLLGVMIGCGSGRTTTTSTVGTTLLTPPITPTNTPPPGPQFTNPLAISTAAGTTIASCPDPSIIRGQTPDDTAWYLYCTADRFTDGAAVHQMPISRSYDLVHWTYVGDVFSRTPQWVAVGGALWAPDIQFLNGKYYLYYAVSKTVDSSASAIYVATGDTPTGPWTASSTPVVESAYAPCCSEFLRSTIDPAVVQDGGQLYIFYGSFPGGISARKLTADGMHSDAASEVQITLQNRYEAPYIVKRDGYFYLFVSAGTCCDEAYSGYAVFAGRSTNILGPYVDRDGNSLLDARVGGTPVMAASGNHWVGPGHNAVVTDLAGQDWIIYHAIDRGSPKFAGSWTKRPVMMDRLEWIDGWPRVRGGLAASEQPELAPVTNASGVAWARGAAQQDVPGPILTSYSDEFDGDKLASRWRWVRKPSSSMYGLSNGWLRISTHWGDLQSPNMDAPVLLEDAPAGDYMVEVKVSNTVPEKGVFNYVQSGLVIYASDTSYVKLASSAIDVTRQIEFGKQAMDGSKPRYGATFLASPADATYLRLVRRAASDGEIYTAYSSHDGVTWERGGTWTHQLGSGAGIGLVSMSGAGFTSYFDYIRVYSLAN